MTKSLIMLLCAAHMVEKKSLGALKEQMEVAENAAIYERIKAHLVETQWQVSLLEACLEFQGIDKNFLDRKTCKLADRINGLDLVGIKQFEIRIYSKIIAAARKTDAPEILQACREILEQDRTMAEWIEDNSYQLNPAFI